MMFNTWFSLIAQLSMMTVLAAVNPGMISRITPNGFRFLNDVGVQKIEEMVKQYPIPPQSGKSHGISYKLWNVEVVDFDIPISELRAGPGPKLTISASNMYMKLSGNFEVKFFGSHSGDFDAFIKNISLSISVFVAESDGRPSVDTSSSYCTFNVRDVYLDLHGHKFISRKLADRINDYLNENGCSEIVDAVNTQLQQRLTKLTMVASIYEGMELDYSLLRTPTVTDHVFDITHKGEVYATGHHSEMPGPRPRFPVGSDQSRMFYVWISDYLINSAGYVLHNIGYLHYNVTQDDIPDGSEVSLNTSQFPMAMLFPQVRKLFPDMMAQFHIQSTKQPVVNTTAEKVTFTVNGEISAYVTNPKNTLTYLFTLGFEFSASVNVAIKRQNVTWVSSFEGVSLELVDSAIDDLKIDFLKSVLPSAITKYVIPRVNAMGVIGKEIPSFEDYHSTNAFICQGEGFLKFGTDLRFYSPAEKVFEGLFELFISK
uniref:LBP-BPI2 n=1 Tax=Stichopus japonicus TaxID=307972 RepID=A0A0F7KYR1_STIJA|nr:LBP-BPI2 [Apostichopus japonicus]